MDAVDKKARELRERFTRELFVSGYHISKPMINLCAIICVDEIIALHKSKSPNYESETYWHPIDFYQQVKERLLAKQ